MVQLGENLFESLLITPKAQERTLKALAHYAALMKRHEVSEVHAFATSAMREATNANELQEQALKETGINLQVISGEKEAELIANGIIQAHGPFESPHLLVDIGGGSTEVTVVLGTEIVASLSMPLGAVRCQERELARKYPPKQKGLTTLRKNIQEEASPILAKLSADTTPTTLVGSSGSIRAILRTITGSQQEEFPSCSMKELASLNKTFTKKKYRELRREYGFEKRRAQVIVAASIILEEIASIFGISTLKAVPQGLKDGVMTLLEQQKSIV